MAKILVVEDEAAIADLIRMNLRFAGHESTHAARGDAVMDAFLADRPDLVLLDVMLPGLDGFGVMEKLRPTGVPVIFLTAKDSLRDKVRGLQLGADDYVVKPFEALELLTRIEAVLRRTGPRAAEPVRLCGLEIRLEERTVRKNGEPVDLTVKEFQLLEVLLRNRNIALTRDRLIELVWGYDYLGETRTVDVHIQRLRSKLSLESAIKTVHKVGYRLEVT